MRLRVSLEDAEDIREGRPQAESGLEDRLDEVRL